MSWHCPICEKNHHGRRHTVEWVHTTCMRRSPTKADIAVKRNMLHRISWHPPARCPLLSHQVHTPGSNSCPAVHLQGGRNGLDGLDFWGWCMGQYPLLGM